MTPITIFRLRAIRSHSSEVIAEKLMLRAWRSARAEDRRTAAFTTPAARRSAFSKPMTSFFIHSARSCTLWLVVTILGHALPAQAQHAAKAADAQDARIEPDFRPAFERCWKEAGSTAAAKARCVRNEMGYQDRQLNSNYTRLMKMLPPTERDLLRQDERRWLTERSKACTPGPGETDAQSLLNGKYCTLYRTALQAKELGLRYELEK